MRYRSAMPIKKGSHYKPHPTDAVLIDLYEVQRLSTREIGRRFSAAASTVRAWLCNAGVTLRTISDAKRGQKPAAHTVEASVRARRKRPLEGRAAVGYKLRSDGYVYVSCPAHPDATASGYLLEHRLVMERVIGRRLLPHEDVHHRNEVRHDNRPENLELVAHADHLRSHYSERSIDPDTGRFLPRSHAEKR